jgi:hypothetical protein
MRAKLYIKGLKEPKELTYFEGRAAEGLIVSNSPPDTPFSIQGVWSGHKADMRHVDWDKPEKRSTETPEAVVTDKQREAIALKIDETSKWLKSRGIIK